jgi:ABC-type phosphate transport system substrate-binding protein
MNRRSLLIATIALVAPFVMGNEHAQAGIDEISVVVNKTCTVSSMNRSQLSALFKAKSSQFPGGTTATAVNLPPESPSRQDFDSAVLGLSPDEVERFWLDSKIRSGVGSPRKLSGPASVVRFVGGDPTGIGYVPSADASSAVRVVARIRGGEVLAP